MSLIEKAIEKLRADAAMQQGPRPVSRPLGAPARVEVVAGSEAPPPVTTRKISIDREALRGAAYFPEAGTESRFANYYRQIKAPVLQRAFAPGATPEQRVVLVSSALPGDGKTFNSINLALSLARERDSSVLLVDADVPKPRVSNILGIEGERGLLDALVNETLDPESLVLRTDVPGLELLPSGTRTDNASELLTSARMRQISARLCSSNARRIVLFDAPPLLVSSEARALLLVPGQILLVVRAFKTPRRAVRDALGLIEEDRLTGVILNEGSADLGANYYYDYASYDSEEPKKKKRAE